MRSGEYSSRSTLQLLRQELLQHKDLVSRHQLHHIERPRTRTPPLCFLQEKLSEKAAILFLAICTPSVPKFLLASMTTRCSTLCPIGTCARVRIDTKHQQPSHIDLLISFSAAVQPCQQILPYMHAHSYGLEPSNRSLASQASLYIHCTPQHVRQLERESFGIISRAEMLYETNIRLGKPLRGGAGGIMPWQASSRWR